jgi:D-alanyl-D-alanine carboxypeptidase (penicillin-binding protein 5/6)
MRFIIFSLALLLIFTAPAAQALDTLAKQAILVDLTTDTVLYEKNADELMHPSSMSKLMTTYAVLEKLKNGSLNDTDTFPVSEKAWRMGGSKMFVHVGHNVTVKDLLNGISIVSGNDACIVVAEGISGSEEAFAEMLTRKGKEIGLTNSTFKNATGWPDDGHLMTARDLYRLASTIIKQFPEHQNLFGQKEMTYSGITQQNRNPLLDKNIGVDGMKTGHTEAGGYGITISGEQNGRRVVLVVNGLSSTNERSAEAERLYLHAFRAFDVKTPFKTGETITEIPVWMGGQDKVALTVTEDVKITLPKAAEGETKLTVKTSKPVAAPIKKGDKLGTLTIAIPSMSLSKEIPLVAANDVEELTGFARWQKVAFERIFKKREEEPAPAEPAPEAK